jgi:hypothetical protein
MKISIDTLIAALPANLKTFIKEDADQLGFDALKGAVHSILTHSDFADRWDIPMGSKNERIALIEWRNEIVRQYRIKQLV